MVHWTVQFTCCHQKDLLILTDQIMFASWKRAQMMDLKNSQLIVGTPLWMSFCKSNTDGRMYVKSVKEANCRISSVILGVYVDDIIPVSNDSAMLKAEKAALNVCERFEMIDLEDNYTLSSWYINQARQRVKNIDNMWLCVRCCFPKALHRPSAPFRCTVHCTEFGALVHWI